ncbi:uncharacterized protein [Blastocystis hominis]|uniref:PHD-type domain-containing protein n=1 Tax=Blastocystis hominis TaxID=12968 RepID=D8M429_BLAHO|nr:uncharacterized protein [Blastocystis hominis]CBK22818.2 unnamed protein product [Blastocystis hominis]|eukprot:XP_012896866.1 uncharacterized protein [Blastocystis hominis]
MSSFSDNICAICERPNCPVRCSGGCLRSFHIQCLRLTSVPDRSWKCNDCVKRSHECFECKQRELDSELVQCSYPDCRRYFHKREACCRCNPRSLSTLDFVCPSHRCYACHGPSDMNNPLLKCFRCTKCYHYSCLPPSVQSLDSKRIRECLQPKPTWRGIRSKCLLRSITPR